MQKSKRRTQKHVVAAKVGSRLKQLRLAHGLKQIQIAKATGIRPPSWNKYELGREMISVNHAAKVLCETGATLDWIYLGRKETLPPQLLLLLQLLQLPQKKNGNGKD